MKASTKILTTTQLKFLCAEKLEERPRLVKDIKDADWIEFFSHQANLLKAKIVE